MEGRNYGRPHLFEDGKVNPAHAPPEGLTIKDLKATSTASVLTYDAHAAPMAMVFYTGEAFPAEYRGDAFVAMRGSWNRKTPSGYEVVRIRFAGGRPVGIEPFVTGFILEGGRSTGAARAACRRRATGRCF